jgi:5-methylcytosine-specific restriction protein B
MFSPKVLDRANVIEFRVSETEMSTFFNEPKELNMSVLRNQGSSMGVSFADKANEKGLVADDLKEVLMPFFNGLQNAGAEFGYRSAIEISRFIKICGELAQENMTKCEVIDAAIIQKLLPKLHGSRNKIEKILKELGSLCLSDIENDSFQTNKDDQTDKYPVKYPLSYIKLKQMHKRVLSDGFTSFAEA